MGQATEINAAFTLCLDQPAATALRAKVDTAVQYAKDLADGTVFQGGVKRVGTDIQPGSYVSEGQIDGYYWERLDAQGNIVDNNFLDKALRVEVDIRATDYSFSSTNCGTWRRAG